MDFSIDNKITSKVVKAAAEFELIKKNDKIAVGLSGGKDSSFLLYMLKMLQNYSAVNFKLKAVHVDLGFEGKKTKKVLEDFCRSLDLDLKIIKTNISEYIKDPDIDNPCSKCTHFRKGALIKYLKKIEYNKLAFGHHLDDAAETFIMNVFYAGQLKTLQPLRYLSESKVSIIRPLIYLREKSIKIQAEDKNINSVSSSCPYDGNTMRSTVRENFKDYFEDPTLFANLISAMRNKSSTELWPEKTNFKKLKSMMRSFWN